MAGRVSLGLALAALTALGAPILLPRADAQKKGALAVPPRLGVRPKATVAKGMATPPRRVKRRRRRRGPGRVLRLQGDVIKGRVQKPEAFYVLQRTGVTFDGLKLNTKLVPKILRALGKPPF